MIKNMSQYRNKTTKIWEGLFLNFSLVKTSCSKPVKESRLKRKKHSIQIFRNKLVNWRKMDQKVFNWMLNLISMFKIAEAFTTSLNLLVILKNLVVNINICNSHSVYPCSGGAEVKQKSKNYDSRKMSISEVS